MTTEGSRPQMAPGTKSIGLTDGVSKTWNEASSGGGLTGFASELLESVDKATSSDHRHAIRRRTLNNLRNHEVDMKSLTILVHLIFTEGPFANEFKDGMQESGPNQELYCAFFNRVDAMLSSATLHDTVLVQAATVQIWGQGFLRYAIRHGWFDKVDTVSFWPYSRAAAKRVPNWETAKAMLDFQLLFLALGSIRHEELAKTQTSSQRQRIKTRRATFFEFETSGKGITSEPLLGPQARRVDVEKIYAKNPRRLTQSNIEKWNLKVDRNGDVTITFATLESVTVDDLNADALAIAASDKLLVENRSIPSTPPNSHPTKTTTGQSGTAPQQKETGVVLDVVDDPEDDENDLPENLSRKRKATSDPTAPSTSNEAIAANKPAKRSRLERCCNLEEHLREECRGEETDNNAQDEDGGDGDESSGVSQSDDGDESSGVSDGDDDLPHDATDVQLDPENTASASTPASGVKAIADKLKIAEANQLLWSEKLISNEKGLKSKQESLEENFGNKKEELRRKRDDTQQAIKMLYECLQKSSDLQLNTPVSSLRTIVDKLEIAQKNEVRLSEQVGTELLEFESEQERLKERYTAERRDLVSEKEKVDRGIEGLWDSLQQICERRRASREGATASG